MLLKKENNPYIEVDLDGPNGNAFYLLGLVKKLNKNILCMGEDENKKVCESLMTMDYNNLIQYIEDNFGAFVILKSDHFEQSKRTVAVCVDNEGLENFDPGGSYLIKRNTFGLTFCLENKLGEMEEVLKERFELKEE